MYLLIAQGLWRRSVVGHVAGKMARTNIVGYVASFPIPEVVRRINSAYLAAKANPYVKFKIIWIFTWYDQQRSGCGKNTYISGRRCGTTARR